MSNQAWRIAEPGKLTLVDLPMPKPLTKQVLVRIHAVSLNYRDIMIVDHNPDYIVKAKANLVPTSDGAGVIEDVGDGSLWKKGDRVLVHPNNWSSGVDPRNFDIKRTLGGGEFDGTLQRYFLVDEDRVIKAPDSLSFEEASTIYTAGVTAWHSLQHALFKLEPGMTVLTQGTGGVSCYAIQIAAAIGATVVATSSSDDKLRAAQELGAKHLINYRKTPNFAAEVLRVTDGKGVDIVVDVVGAQTLEQSIQSTRYGGVMVLSGILSENPHKPVNFASPLLFGAKTIQAILGAGSKDMAEELAAFMEKHRIHPPIAQRFSFEESAQAIEALRNLTAPGKIVITF